MPPLLLDTHAAIWSALGTVTPSARKAIDAAAGRGELLLSPISAWEIGMLVAKGRLELAMPVETYVDTLYALPGVVTAALTPKIAAAAASLPGEPHGDPADRLLIATAAAFGATLVTRDERILHYARVTRYVRCASC